MTIADTIREEAAKKTAASSRSPVDAVRKAAEAEAEAELERAIKSGKGSAVRQALKRLKAFDDDD